jgi:pimeloyl-ACP methyl ester carboxylesterase
VKRFLVAGSKNGVFDDHELEAFAAPLRDRERAPVSAKYYRTFQAHDLPLLVRRHWRKYRLTVPTLMLHGTDDFAMPPSSLAGYEPYADDLRIEFVQDTGHFIVDARPGVVAARALEFFGNR